MSLEVETRGAAVRFRVKVQARARREEIVGEQGGLLRLRVTAPPIEGRANQAAVALLAEHLRVPKSSIKIAAGERAPIKLVEVAGLAAATIAERLRPAAARRGAGGPE
jgi:uncharacterized protein (TIGR00251 family)